MLTVAQNQNLNIKKKETIQNTPKKTKVAITPRRELVKKHTYYLNLVAQIAKKYIIFFN